MFIKYQGQNSCSNEINNDVCYILQGQALYMCQYILVVSLYLELHSPSLLNSLGSEKTVTMRMCKLLFTCYPSNHWF